MSTTETKRSFVEKVFNRDSSRSLLSSNGGGGSFRRSITRKYSKDERNPSSYDRDGSSDAWGFQFDSQGNPLPPPDILSGFGELDELSQTRLTTLLTVLHHTERRRELIKIVSVDGDDQTASKLRFCFAVDGYSVTPEGLAKEAKGKKLVTLFALPSSMFLVKGIPLGAQGRLKADNFQDLHQLRIQFLKDLAANERVLDGVERVEKLE
jgi:hypothetical protein